MKILRYILEAPFNILFYAIFGGYFLLLFVVYYVLIKIKRQWSHNMVQVLNKIWAIVGSIVMFTTTRSKGKHKLKGIGPVVYIVNHSSFWDIPVVSMVLTRHFRFLGKAELGKVPLFGLMFSEVHIPVNRASRTDGARSLIASRKKLEEGISIAIFPEGTIPDKKTVVLSPFKEGAFRLALEAGVSIVPMTVIGSDKVLPDGKIPWFTPFQQVKVIIGDPISTKDMKVGDLPALKEKVHNLIYANLTNKDAWKSTTN